MDRSTSLSVKGKILHPGPFNCDSSNVIYLLTCDRCPSVFYIGQTDKAFRLRFNNHKSSIHLNKPGFPVAKHFNSSGHNLSNLKFAIIEGNFKSPARRLLRETELIISLGTNKADSLNKDIAFLSDLKYFK